MESNMGLVVVNIADMVISANPDDILVTYSLGSCLGVTVYDPVTKIGGLIHCMLPLSKVDRSKAAAKPYMFVDTGVTLFLKQLFEMGAKKSNIIVKAIGAARILDHKGLFNIGERNHTVFRKITWKNSIIINAEDVGGNKSRTVRLYLDTGLVTIKNKGNTIEL